MTKTPGQLLVEMLDKVMVEGEDPTELKMELDKATCRFFSRQGTKVTCGDFESTDGEPVIERKNGNST